MRTTGAYEPEKQAQLFLGLAHGEPEHLAAEFVKLLQEEYQTGEREGNVVRLDVQQVINDLAPGATLAEGQTVRIGKREPYRSLR